MIITCPCKKQFKIDSSLIPQEGENCNVGLVKIWFTKKKNQTINLNENVSRKQKERRNN